MSGGRGRGRESSSRLPTEPGAGLSTRPDLTTHEIMTCANTKSWVLNRLGHLGAPASSILKDKP